MNEHKAIGISIGMVMAAAVASGAIYMSAAQADSEAFGAGVVSPAVQEIAPVAGYAEVGEHPEEYEDDHDEDDHDEEPEEDDDAEHAEEAEESETHED
jgi:hypothetical protein